MLGGWIPPSNEGTATAPRPVALIPSVKSSRGAENAAAASGEGTRAPRERAASAKQMSSLEIDASTNRFSPWEWAPSLILSYGKERVKGFLGFDVHPKKPISPIQKGALLVVNDFWKLMYIQHPPGTKQILGKCGGEWFLFQGLVDVEFLQKGHPKSHLLKPRISGKGLVMIRDWNYGKRSVPKPLKPGAFGKNRRSCSIGTAPIYINPVAHLFL